MYSIVMLAAMSAAPEAPEFNGLFSGLFHHKSWHGCSGCYGGCRGCYGSSCYGSSCYGCYGSSCYGSSCYGCYGSSCYGSSCYGGCTGCTGVRHYYAPVGCHGCQGTCTGCTGFYSGCGGYSVGHHAAYHTTSYGFAVVDYTFAAPQYQANVATDRAQVVVRVPEGAKLYADGHATSLTGTERSFLTPAISTGRDYQYTLKVEYVEAGLNKSAEQKVTVRAGHRTAVDFVKNAVEDKVASNVTVTLPEKAKLYVDGVEAAKVGGTHAFKTPELPKGRPFAYQFRAEVEIGGRVETQTQRIVFKAGEPVSVDFTEMNAVRTAAR